jgi:hypothetical protein
VSDPRVVDAYLGASDAVIGRSGSAIAEALVVAGVRSKDPDEDAQRTQPRKRTRKG